MDEKIKLLLVLSIASTLALGYVYWKVNKPTNPCGDSGLVPCSNNTKRCYNPKARYNINPCTIVE